MYKTNHIYMISNKKDGVLYIGVTNHLERRIFEHKNKLIKGFSSRYNLVRLIYFEQFQLIQEAIKREKNMKKWKRAWKINLIVKDNPEWKDLSKDWYQE